MKPTIFVSSSSESLPFVDLLAQELSSDAEVIGWSNAATPLERSPIPQLVQSFSNADFAVFILDVASGLAGRHRRPPDNLIFELGLALGTLGLNRVLIVDVANDTSPFRLPRDFAGLTMIRVPTSDLLNDPSQLRHYVVEEIRRHTLGVQPRRLKDKATYSCFISYSHEDSAFASRLFKDLSDIGVRCWLDTHELRTGDSIREQIRTALLTTDKFLPILSMPSVDSQWFQYELRQALLLEANRSTKLLMPIRIDDAVFSLAGNPWDQVNQRLIADFRDWQSETAYNKAFRQLSLNLAASVSDDRVSGGR